MRLEWGNPLRAGVDGFKRAWEEGWRQPNPDKNVLRKTLPAGTRAMPAPRGLHRHNPTFNQDLEGRRGGKRKQNAAHVKDVNSSVKSPGKRENKRNQTELGRGGQVSGEAVRGKSVWALLVSKIFSGKEKSGKEKGEVRGGLNRIPKEVSGGGQYGGKGGKQLATGGDD